MSLLTHRPTPSAADCTALVGAAATAPLLSAALTTALFTGIRAGELLALRVVDYTPGGHATFTVPTGKYGGHRIIRIAPTASRALDAYLDREITEPEEPLLMVGQHQLFAHLVRATAERAGVDVGVHDLRRAAMEAAIRAGLPDYVIAAYFGTSRPPHAHDLAPLRSGWDEPVVEALEGAFAL